MLGKVLTSQAEVRDLRPPSRRQERGTEGDWQRETGRGRLAEGDSRCVAVARTERERGRALSSRTLQEGPASSLQAPGQPGPSRPGPAPAPRAPGPGCQGASLPPPRGPKEGRGPTFTSPPPGEKKKKTFSPPPFDRVEVCSALLRMAARDPPPSRRPSSSSSSSSPSREGEGGPLPPRARVDSVS